MYERNFDKKLILFWAIEKRQIPDSICTSESCLFYISQNTWYFEEKFLAYVPDLWITH